MSYTLCTQDGELDNYLEDIHSSYTFCLPIPQQVSQREGRRYNRVGGPWDSGNHLVDILSPPAAQHVKRFLASGISNSVIDARIEFLPVVEPGGDRIAVEDPPFECIDGLSYILIIKTMSTLGV